MSQPGLPVVTVLWLALKQELRLLKVHIAIIWTPTNQKAA